MLNSPSAPTSVLSTSNASAASSSPSRSRLRGLSYLRNYAHLHHSSSSSARIVAPPPLTRSHTSPSPVPTSPGLVTFAQERGTTAPSPQRTNTADGNATSGWVPAVDGHSGISRLATAPRETATDVPVGVGQPASPMTRARSQTVGEAPSASMADNANSSASSDDDKKSHLPTVRLIPHHDPRSTRPSLMFPIHTRTLPTKDAIIRVGRYSERDNQAASNENDPSSMIPIGFKSKVVSRRHCELWCINDQWYIRDVKSSSGTFLNHVRLSSAGTESRPYPINDGDVVQLGIDFKGGEEMIFRCVKIRIECNRSWQKSLNSFNTSTHQRLRNLTSASRKRDSDAASVHSSECAICLNRVAPCQALFVAPCSHVWHYKCVQKLLFTQYPSFQCPNCRAYADLEADVEDPLESESDSDLDEALRASEASATVGAQAATNGDARPLQLQSSTTRQTLSAQSTSEDDDTDDLTASMASASISRTRVANGQYSPASAPRPIPSTGSLRPTEIDLPQDAIGARSITPTTSVPFALTNDPLSTPRNDEGPFVLDAGIDDVLHSSSRADRRVSSRSKITRPSDDTESHD